MRDEALDRRELFRVLALAAHHASAQHHQPGSAPPPDIASYQPRFFSRAQYETVDRLCELIIPADDMGPELSGRSPVLHRYGSPLHRCRPAVVAARP